MITKDHIDNWIALNATGDNLKEASYWTPSETSLARKLIEAKVLTDRWENVATDFIFHSSKKDFVRAQLGDKLTTRDSSMTTFMAKMKDLKTKFPDLGKAVEKLGQALSGMGTAQGVNIMEEMDKMLKAEAAKQPEMDFIWGARIHYLDDCPVDAGLCLALDHTEEQLRSGNSRSVAVFPM